jgi:effector-binding domain-containing protein
VRSSQYGKANGMMQNYALLSNVLVENEVQLNGRPFLEVTQWNMETDSIRFNFCYPIIQNKNLPKYPQLTYKEFESSPAIKAEYNGNYITSDRAWYILLDYARKQHLEVTGLPVEVFQNNPNMGGDELSWKAEVYMPLKSADE